MADIDAHTERRRSEAELGEAIDEIYAASATKTPVAA